VNQGDNLPGMKRDELERTLELRVVAEIPSDWKTVSNSLNQKEPYVIAAPTAPVSRAIVALAAALIAQQRVA